MSTQYDGGPAFQALLQHSDHHLLQREDGMTLRDYFAAKALEGLIASPDEQLHQQWPTHNRRAEFAYEQADAMLKARQQ